jgi:F-type H+-transporting ATPase subunit delta
MAAELVTIARPYAQAIFDLAKERNELSKWSEMLSLVVAVYDDPQFKAAIASPTVTSAEVEDLMLAVCGEHIDGNVRNFIRLLFRNGRLPALEEIRRLYDRLKSEDEGVVEAQISSAFPLESQQLAQIVSLLSKRYEKNISPTVDVDSDLIGGVKIQVGDKVWDASVRGRLHDMAAALTK